MLRAEEGFHGGGSRFPPEAALEAARRPGGGRERHWPGGRGGNWLRPKGEAPCRTCWGAASARRHLYSWRQSELLSLRYRGIRPTSLHEHVWEILRAFLSVS